MILQEVNGNGHQKKLPTAAVLVPTGEAVTAIQGPTIQVLTAITITRPTAAPTSALGGHFISNAES